MMVMVLQDHILDLTDEIELRKIREEEIIQSHVMDKKHIIDEMEDLKVSMIILHWHQKQISVIIQIQISTTFNSI